MSDDSVPLQTFSFNADITQLMSLIVNTFYSNKSIFLRELVSNASDALDKIRYKSLTNYDELLTCKELKIDILVDVAGNTLTICDTGIGMTKKDMIDNLGTIAKSGTKQFMEATIQKQENVNMIGQFGVGFYSAYLVADKVEVISKHNEDVCHKWTSSAGDHFTIEPLSTCTELTRGTQVILHLKDDMKEYLESSKLKELIKRHCEFINFPISLQVEKEIKDEDDDDVPTIDTSSTTDVILEDVHDEDVNRSEKSCMKTVKVMEVINTQMPIWTKKHDDITHVEYGNFYKSISNDYEDHLAVKHFKVEGQLEFTSLLFVPKRAPFDLFEQKGAPNNIRLYVKKVFITDDCKELIPEYLSFIKGIVDSDDLPLNISREVLQQNKIMKSIKKNLVKKSIEMFESIAENVVDYKTFYTNFSKHIKLGIHEDTSNRQRLSKLLRYYSSKSPDEMISLSDYIVRMKDGQKNIYYMTGENKCSVETSPLLEGLKRRGYEVLYMIDPIDEYCMQQLKEFDDKKLVCATKDGLNVDKTNEEENTLIDQQNKFDDLLKRIKSVLGDKIEKVIISDRIVISPSCLVTSEYGWSANMERIMKAQALRDSSMSSYMTSKKTMEINPRHETIHVLRQRLETDASDISIDDLIWLLYETSLITSGFSLDEPTSLSNRIFRLLQMGSIDDLLSQSTIDEVKNTFDNKLEDQSTETEDDVLTNIHNSKLDQVITSETYAISDNDILDKDIEHEKSDISDDTGVDGKVY